MSDTDCVQVNAGLRVKHLLMRQPDPRRSGACTCEVQCPARNSSHSVLFTHADRVASESLMGSGLGTDEAVRAAANCRAHGQRAYQEVDRRRT